MLMKTKKVAIVHDWLIGGGAEKVVEQLHRIYPDAPIYTSYCTDEWRKKLDYKVITGPLQAWPFSRLRKYIPFLRIWWFSSLKFDDYDLVISSSGAEAKGIKVRRSEIVDSRSQTTNYKLQTTKPIHINYCHAPTHYYWSRYDDYLRDPGFGRLNWLARFGLKTLVGPLRSWDLRAAQRPDLIIANSTHTQQAIKKYYGRDSEVIHPPVDIKRFEKGKMKNDKSQARHGFVIVGRQTPYKRIDLAVAACTETKMPLTVIGGGPEHKKLRKIAGPNITFLTNADDATVAKVIGESEGFIFPGVDDFGIVAIEAMAAGTPVIAFNGGGARDYIIPGKTGEFFDHQTVGSLVAALQQFDSKNYSSDEIKQFAQSFSNEHFRRKLIDFVKNHL
jgi:glycosyltransferase involved in cell wall biosynthesis